MDANSHSEHHYIRVLALDAGGVKCISTLLILQELMPRSRSEASGREEVAKPCDYFHLICGSQWGGVLAIMLGRLKMTIPDCLEWLKKILWTDPSFLISMIPKSTDRNSRHFEALFRSLLESQGHDEEALFFDADENLPPCKTLVLAFDIYAPSLPTRFRSYQSKMDMNPHRIEIWRLALAAVCNPNIMKPVPLDEHTVLIDASVAGYSNPSREALDEACRIWDPLSIKTLLNIGTGDRAQTSDPGGLSSGFISFVHLAFIKFLREIASDPEKVSQELKREALLKRFNYHRFSVDNGLNVVHSSDWTLESRKDIVAHTKKYLRRVEPEIRLWSGKLMRDGPFQLPQQWDEGRIPESERTIPPQTKIVRSNTRPKNLMAAGHSTLRDIIEPESSNNISYALFDAQGAESEMRDLATCQWFQRFNDHVPLLFPQTEWPAEIHKIRIAVLDTGVDGSHEFMVDDRGHTKIQGFKDFTSDSTLANERAIDTCGHGTHVSGLILQLAPHAELFVARVFESGFHEDNNSILAAERVAAAINHAVKAWNVNIISMSFGFKFKRHQTHIGLKKAILDAYDSNVVMFAAASNNGNMDFEPIAYPARDPHVFCVNSSHAYGKSSLFNPQAAEEGNNFSILGQCVLSTWPRALPLKTLESPGNDGEDNGVARLGIWKRSSGTSVATPIAAAIAVLIMQFGRLNEDMIDRQFKLETFQGIQQLLSRMSVKHISERFRNIIPWSVLDSQDFDETLFQFITALDNI